MQLRDLRPPVEDGPYPPPAFLPPLTGTEVHGARTWTGLTYAVVRGHRPLALDVHVPADATYPVPLVVWIHGGGWTEGDRRLVPLQWGQQTLFDKVVAAGMAVATIDYRFLGEAPFPACLHDCVAAVRYLRRYAAELGLDASRLGLWGESAGAHLAAMVAFLGTRDDAPAHLVGDLGVRTGQVDSRAAVLFYGPDRLDGLVGPPPPGGHTDPFFGWEAFGQDPELLRQLAPIEHVHRDAPATLLMHGDQDSVVGHGASERLYQALLAVGADSTLEITPGAEHCFIGTPIEPHLDRAVDFLGSHLGGAKASGAARPR